MQPRKTSGSEKAKENQDAPQLMLDEIQFRPQNCRRGRQIRGYRGLYRPRISSWSLATPVTPGVYRLPMGL